MSLKYAMQDIILQSDLWKDAQRGVIIIVTVLH